MGVRRRRLRARAAFAALLVLCFCGSAGAATRGPDAAGREPGAGKTVSASAPEGQGRALYDKAKQAYERGDMHETLSLVEQSLQRDSGMAEAQALRGVALEQTGREEEAMAAYREAIRLKPDYAEAYRNLALLLHRRQEFAEALEVGRKAVEFEPRNADSLNNLGVAAFKMGILGEAESVLRRSLELDPSSISAHYNLGLVCAQEGKVAEAIDNLEIAYQGAQEMRDTYRRDWIGEVCNRLLANFPDDGGAWKVHRLLGRLYFEQGWYGSAIPHLQAAAERRDFYSLLHLGIAYKQKALTQEAIDALRRAVRTRPGDYQAHNELGHALGTLAEDWPQAEKEFRRAIEARPDSAEVRYNLAYALFRQDRFDQAKQEFKEAFRLQPAMADSEHYKGLNFPN
jgi:tetratricopeptide (TPR) repeat protein